MPLPEAIIQMAVPYHGTYANTIGITKRFCDKLAKLCRAQHLASSSVEVVMFKKKDSPFNGILYNGIVRINNA
jgi:hypothetical protein